MHNAFSKCECVNMHLVVKTLVLFSINGYNVNEKNYIMIAFNS